MVDFERHPLDADAMHIVGLVQALAARVNALDQRVGQLESQPGTAQPLAWFSTIDDALQDMRMARYQSWSLAVQEQWTVVYEAVRRLRMLVEEPA